NGYYPIKQETLEEINENGTANQKKIIDYAVLTNGSKVQFKWPEEELAAISYDVFYDSLLAVAFGEDIDNLNPNYSGSNEKKKYFLNMVFMIMKTNLEDVIKRQRDISRVASRTIYSKVTDRQKRLNQHGH